MYDYFLKIQFYLILHSQQEFFIIKFYQLVNKLLIVCQGLWILFLKSIEIRLINIVLN